MIRKNWIYKVIRPFIKEEYREDIEGDLQELYEHKNQPKKNSSPDIKIAKEAANLLRFELLRLPYSINTNPRIMITHYIKVAFRSLLKNKVTSSVSLAGLSLGLACVILAYSYISYHTYFDSFHSKKERTYRLIRGDLESQDGWVKVPAPLLSRLKSVVPEIESYTYFEPISQAEKVLVESREDKFYESYFSMVSPAFFEMFDFPLISGDKSNVISDPANVVISERIKKKIFGDNDPIGKTIRAFNEFDFIVSGVIQDAPEQSHLKFDYLISFENLGRIQGENMLECWGCSNYYAYITIPVNTNPEVVIEKIRDFSYSTEGYNYSFENLGFQPITDIHFQHNRGNLLPSVNPVYLWIFASISAIVLIIALANYVNLSIAISIKRAREYGVRKALGAARGSLVVQFFSETFISMLVAVLVAALLVYTFLPAINNLLGTSIEFRSYDYQFWIAIAGITILSTLLASSYLAITVSAFNPVTILKGNMKVKKGLGLQNILLGIQFILSMILIVNALIITDQLNFIRNKNLGLNPEGVINVPLYNRLDSLTLNTLKSEIRRIPGVINTSASTFVPGTATWHQGVSWEGQTEEEADQAYMYILAVDKDFVRTMGLDLVYGDLEEIENSTTRDIKFLVNESGFKFLGWEDPKEKRLSPFGANSYAYLSAIVKDFNFKSLHDGMDPLLIAVSDRFFHEQLSIRVKTDNLSSAIGEIEDTFTEVMKGLPFEYFLLNDKIESLYKAETETGKLIFYSTLFALLLATLGLFGILSFTIEERTKEIAIRKILGISIPQMVLLFSRKYFLILVMATVIAWPVSYFLMNSWLDNFAYKTGLGIVPFLAGTIITLLLIVTVIAAKMINIKKLDPVNALKYE